MYDSEIFIGRAAERSVLEKAYSMPRSRFVAVFGRRRVGKTFLVRKTFQGVFAFQTTAIANATTEQQLINFFTALQRQGHVVDTIPKNWFFAFQMLIDHLEKQPEGKKVVFFDELPWFDTKKSDFVQSLEHFWNSWASARSDVLLVTCGSSASWMINELIKNKGGLHNRVTDRIRLEPFTLRETEQFLHSKNPQIDRYSILQLYMVMGGIPFYLDAVAGEKSAMQNIEHLCFSKDGLLWEEFSFLLQSLFAKAERHVAVLEALSSKVRGLTRKEIAAVAKLHGSGHLTLLLRELEESGFIGRYVPFGKKKRDTLYRLSDFYVSFYFKFIQGRTLLDSGNWLSAMEGGAYRAWSGYAFEQICLMHVGQLKKALQIQGVVAQTSSWRGDSAQIDLLIDRKDRVINLFEIKFSEKPFSITKDYAAKLAQKIEGFKEETATRKSVFLTMLTTFGLVSNAYASAMVQHDFDMGVLFE